MIFHWHCIHSICRSLSLSLSHLHGFHFACCFRPEWCGSFSNSLRSVARGTSFYGALVQFWNGADFQHDGRSRLFRFVTFSFFKKKQNKTIAGRFSCWLVWNGKSIVGDLMDYFWIRTAGRTGSQLPQSRSSKWKRPAVRTCSDQCSAGGQRLPVGPGTNSSMSDLPILLGPQLLTERTPWPSLATC